ncbi:amino acid ABC transporter membrane protein 1 (PAAT family) [Paraburkholderia silvatlantica]|uniref:Amino acid ABC transporter membrane protein 1 (PAAT family) n=1 Tax=Paraburkholderia silvatlantica TaxID=321895 RepID=A0A2V4T5F5_9BURK|nr:amino acid ABC transporter permease [Paraburkholderia silvatlantica]PYE15693.1 amino acid ABC transporter membrane protein 1 (PAAT family) [Paraburkholderia silvatlantica]
MNAVSELFRWVNAHYGLNFSVFYDAFEFRQFVDGIGITLWLSFASVVGSIAVGIVGAFMQRNPSRLLRILADAYVWIFRNTPPLVQLFFFYFALGPTLTHLAGAQAPVIGSIGWAIISLVLFAGAYNVEIFRAGIEAVPYSMLEASSSLGMTHLQTFRKVILPLAGRISLPALNNNLVNLIKTTTNAYAIAVPELLYVSSQIWAQDLNTLEMMIVLLIFYIVVVGLFVRLMHMLEKSLAVPGWGSQ